MVTHQMDALTTLLERLKGLRTTRDLATSQELSRWIIDGGLESLKPELLKYLEQVVVEPLKPKPCFIVKETDSKRSDREMKDVLTIPIGPADLRKEDSFRVLVAPHIQNVEITPETTVEKARTLIVGRLHPLEYTELKFFTSCGVSPLPAETKIVETWQQFQSQERDFTPQLEMGISITSHDVHVHAPCGMHQVVRIGPVCRLPDLKEKIREVFSLPSNAPLKIELYGKALTDDSLYVYPHFLFMRWPPVFMMML